MKETTCELCKNHLPLFTTLSFQVVDCCGACTIPRIIFENPELLKSVAKELERIADEPMRTHLLQLGAGAEVRILKETGRMITCIVPSKEN